MTKVVESSFKKLSTIARQHGINAVQLRTVLVERGYAPQVSIINNSPIVPAAFEPTCVDVIKSWKVKAGPHFIPTRKDIKAQPKG